jgi:hypothetical protein
MKSIEERFANIRTYSEGGQRSLHKPLLLLFALGYCYLGRERMISFSVIDEALIRLFDKFYPAASERANTHYPFGRLEFDGIWELEQSATLSRTSVGHLFKSELLEKHIHAGLSLEIHEALSSDKNRLTNIASQLLHRYFPENQHIALRVAVGLPSFVEGVRDIWAEYSDSTTHLQKPTLSDLTKEPALTTQYNGFIAYLNSIHNLGAGGANALAETQALNHYFSALYTAFPVVTEIVEALQNGKHKVVVLTGHAGDGKSTVALDVLKHLKNLPANEPLKEALKEREVTHTKNGSVTIVKDMSELSADTRLQWLEEAFNQPGSWLVISNTGPLLNSLCEFGKPWMGAHDIEDQLLKLLGATYIEGHLAEHTLTGFPKDLVILNLTRLDNVKLGTQVLGKMLNHPAWSECESCPAEIACPLRLNRNALQAMGTALEERVRWVYQRLTHYEQRLTLRQIVAHLALSLTGGMGCKEAQRHVEESTAEGAEKGMDGLAKIVFSETFFGYRNGRIWEAADGLRAITLARRLVAGGPVAVDYERQMIGRDADNWTKLPEILTSLWQRWRKDAANFNGVARRFAVRRLDYFFALSEKPVISSDIFFDTFLRSPRLRDFDRWQREGKLTFSPREQKKLRNACLRVLLECYSGFSAGQFESQERLYLTLRRADRAIAQPTQWVIAAPSFDEFELCFDADLSLPIIHYRPKPNIQLKLYLPLLDYIHARAKGELGGELTRIHWAQLDTFRAELLKALKACSDEDEITLLCVGIDGRIHLHGYVLENNQNALEIV